MAVVLQPSQILVAAMAGWITRRQDAVIDYLREENRVLKRQLHRPPRFRFHSHARSPKELSCSTWLPKTANGHFEKATREFAAHYHTERNHQGLDNRLIEPVGRNESTVGPIQCVQRLGGMLRFYHRAVA
jgi:hypothetical protein